MTKDKQGASGKPDRATAVEPVPVSPLRDGIPSAADNPIVGHYTHADGSHSPLRQNEAEALWAQVEADRERREQEMPDEQAAIRRLFEAQYRLQDFGWRDPVYVTKTEPLEIIELGSTGIHQGYYEGEWPTGRWWVVDGDVWPSRPALARPAQVGTHPQGGDAKQAPGDSLSDAVAEGHAPNSSPIPEQQEQSE
jgi:hypothetical protein